MTYAATVRLPGQPPMKLNPFHADDDDMARAIAKGAAAVLHGAVWMLWESKDDKARQVAL